MAELVRMARELDTVLSYELAKWEKVPLPLDRKVAIEVLKEIGIVLTYEAKKWGLSHQANNDLDMSLVEEKLAEIRRGIINTQHEIRSLEVRAMILPDDHPLRRPAEIRPKSLMEALAKSTEQLRATETDHERIRAVLGSIHELCSADGIPAEA